LQGSKRSVGGPAGIKIGWRFHGGTFQAPRRFLPLSRAKRGQRMVSPAYYRAEAARWHKLAEEAEDLEAAHRWRALARDYNALAEPAGQERAAAGHARADAAAAAAATANQTRSGRRIAASEQRPRVRCWCEPW